MNSLEFELESDILKQALDRLIASRELKTLILKCGGPGSGVPGPCPGPEQADEPKTDHPKADEPKADHEERPREKPSNLTPTGGQIVGPKEQRHAEGMQDRLASDWKGAKSIPGNAPSDVEHVSPCCRQQIEMKTLLTSKRGNIRMTQAAQVRKLQRLEEQPPATRRLWTVAYDHREAYASDKLDTAPTFPLYIREGCGHFNVKKMHRVESAQELVKLTKTPSDKLPEAARPPQTGFYAQWQSAGKKERKKMAEAALKKERDRIERKRKP